MEHVESLARMAFLTAEVRAGEAEREPRLFDDPYAPLFSSPMSKAALAGVTKRGPLFTTGMRVRTRWFDEVLQRELDGGTRQVLLLGAGLDCRALRFARPGVIYFEVDAPKVLAFKAERLAQAGHPRGAVVVSMDWLLPELLERLDEHGFDPSRRTLVLWEGIVYYLLAGEVRRLLESLAGPIPDVRVALDYFGTAVVECRSPVRQMNEYGRLVRALGVPWQTGVDDADALAREAGLRVVEGVSFAQLLARLLPQADLGDGATAEFGMCLMGR